MNKYVCFSSSSLNKTYDVITVCQCRKACEMPCKDCKYYDACGGTVPKTMKEFVDIGKKYNQIIKKQYQQHYKTYEQ